MRIEQAEQAGNEEEVQRLSGPFKKKTKEILDVNRKIKNSRSYHDGLYYRNPKYVGSPLHVAVKNAITHYANEDAFDKDFRTIHFLIKAGANLNPINNYKLLETPLHYAIRLSSSIDVEGRKKGVALAKFLIKEGADVNLDTSNPDRTTGGDTCC